MNKLNKKLFFILIFLLFLIYLFFSKQIYINSLENNEFPKIISAVEVNLNSIIYPYINIEKKIIQDQFIHSWIKEPNKNNNDLICYLNNLSKTFNLEHASFIDDNSLIYYGSDKIIKLDSNNIKRDGWYFDYRNTNSFQNIKSTYYIDKIYPKTLTIFINIPIMNDDKYLGVAGGGFYYKNFDCYLNQMERLYNVEINLLNTNKLIYTNNQTSFERIKDLQLEEYKKYTDGTFIKKDGENSLTFIKYLPKWDNYLIISRSNKEIMKALVLEIVLAFIFIAIIFTIIIIINSTNIDKKRKKQKEENTIKEFLYLMKEIKSIITNELNLYTNKKENNNDIINLLNFENQLINISYDIIEKRNINNNSSCDISELLKKTILLELPKILNTDLKTDVRLLNESNYINLDKEKFVIFIQTLITLLYFKTDYKEIIIFEETYKNKIKFNLIIVNPKSKMIINKTENIFKKLFSSINLNYLLISNSTKNNNTQIIQIIYTSI